MATVRRRHFEFMEGPSGFPSGETRIKVVNLVESEDLRETAIAATATPFVASNETRRLRVVDIVVRAEDPNPPNNFPTVRITVESLGPDAPIIWYLNLGIIEP